MPREPLSEHCALMTWPGGPPRPLDRPADCPRDAAYIKTKGGGAWTLNNKASFPVVIEGDEGDDHVTIVGDGGKGVIVSGGAGSDSVTLVPNQWVFVAGRMSGTELALLGGLAMLMAALVTIAWRALAASGERR